MKPAIERSPTLLEIDPLDIRRLDLSEYHRMIELGILDEDERIELIEGVLHRMSPKGPRHSAGSRRLVRVFIGALGEQQYLYSSQDPITFPTSNSEPEPDFAILVPREGDYADRHPLPEDVLLLVEIADSSLPFDRSAKVRLYASAGIDDYWIMNLVDNQIEVYRTPVVRVDGTADYEDRQFYVAGDTITPLHFPDCGIDVAALLP